MFEQNIEKPLISMDDALAFLKELYDKQGSLYELPSERDRNFLLQCSDGSTFVLKIANQGESLESLEGQNDAMRHIAPSNQKALCPSPIPSKTGNLISTITDKNGCSYFIRLLTFIPGNTFAKTSPHDNLLLYPYGVFIGQISSALASFDHESTHKEFHWDLKNAADVISLRSVEIKDSKKRDLVNYFLLQYNTIVLPNITNLRSSVIHNDFNDNNVIVKYGNVNSSPNFGLIDFGDIVYSCTIFELAIAIAYAILGKNDPLSTAVQILEGYHSHFPVEEKEVGVLFTLICARLAVSVCISAYQQTLRPDDEYLRISEKPAWAALQKLRTIHPSYAKYTFRSVCGLEPCIDGKSVSNWLYNNQSKMASILSSPINSISHKVIDMSVGSLDFPNFDDLMSNNRFTSIIEEKMMESNVTVIIGSYNEPRLIYTKPEFKYEGNDREEYRTIHLGIDIFSAPDTPIFAPFQGIVHSFQNNESELDYGPTIILEHQMKSDIKFYTLYGHLSPDSLTKVEIGAKIDKGARIGSIGDIKDNGGWAPHVHFQIIADIMDYRGTYPGVIYEKNRDVWLSICPDPNLILQIPQESFPQEFLSKSEILRIRRDYIGKSLSISYNNPLKIVRGHMQYLYDETGCKYLDAVNNIPHVGHCHPRVNKALQKQLWVLNTNTRYLHENLIRYAERLCETLPDPLSVCFFVSSGSDANELALRLATNYTERKDLIVLDSAYHGNTGALIDISPYKHNGPGGKGTPDYVHKVDLPDTFRGKFRGFNVENGEKYAQDVIDLLQVLKGNKRTAAAFICESLPSCGGQIILPPGYLKHVFHHVRQTGAVCIVDEVQVGFGRVGTHFWGFETQDVVPDIVTMGKPIGNGHPLAAVVTTPDIASSFCNGMEFFSSFGGNPVACAVGMAVLDVIKEENLQENALQVGSYLKHELENLKNKFPLIGDVRGLGLFIGVEIIQDQEFLIPAPDHASYIVNRMKEKGILISTDGPDHNVLKIKPPMVFTKENAIHLVTTLEEILCESILRI
ncbi:MAG: aminotransferase class III-fold pyridoxal phosphate-dependent enzyme [Candidatus Hodarchaeales archaeon]